MSGRWTFVLVLAVAALAFAAGRHTATSPAGFDPARDLQVGPLTTLLGLSDAQASELQSMEATYVSNVSEACDDHCAARCELALCMDSDRFDADRARQLVEKMCEAHKVNEMATIDHIAKIRAVLTPEQRAKFFNLVGQCLCNTCEPGSPTHTATDPKPNEEPAR